MRPIWKSDKGFLRASKEARLRTAVYSYNRTIRNKEMEILRSGMSDSDKALHLSALPMRRTVGEIRSLIHTESDFRRIVGYKSDAARGRTSVLTRILKSVNPRALNLVSAGNVYTTEYSKKERSLNNRHNKRVREQRKKLQLEPLYDGDQVLDFDSMSQAQESAAMDGNGMRPDFGERDDDSEYIDPQLKERWRDEDAELERSSMSTIAQFEEYMEFWKNPVNRHYMLDGYYAMINALEYLLHYRPHALMKLFDSHRDEIDPPWLLISGTPYDSVAQWDERHYRAVRYVTRFAANFGWDDDED